MKDGDDFYELTISVGRNREENTLYNLNEIKLVAPDQIGKAETADAESTAATSPLSRQRPQWAGRATAESETTNESLTQTEENVKGGVERRYERNKLYVLGK